MERKRGVDGEGSSQMPPSKQSRHSVSHTSPAGIGSQGRANAAGATTNNSSDSTPQHVQEYQKAQLVALLEDQRKENKWLRDQFEEQKQVVSFLDAAPRAALYHMASVREDLTLTLARLGLSGTETVEECPIAAHLLNMDEITNESLGDLPAIVKKITAQIIIALEKEHKPIDAEGKSARAQAALCHKRIREISDGMERFAQREREMMVSASQLNDEMADCRHENARQRQRIVNLEHALRSKDQPVLPNGQSSSVGPARSNVDACTNQNNLCSNGPGKVAGSNGVHEDSRSEAALNVERDLSTKRLRELEEMHAKNKDLISQIEVFQCDIAKRNVGVIPMKQILSSALYQTMEVTLQQLYLKEANWQKEREALNEEITQERKIAEEKLNEEKRRASEVIEDYKRQVSDLQKVLDVTKSEKDKAAMSYEARKMESGTIASVNAAWEKRISVSEEMRNKATAAKHAADTELAVIRKRLEDYEQQLENRVETTDGKELTKILRQELDEEKKKTSSFISEVESLSNMYGELETENSRLVKLLAEKEQVLSKVMCERLRVRQQLTTSKEENKALANHRVVSNDKIKKLNAMLEANKKLVSDAHISHNVAVEETRKLQAVVERRMRIAEEMTVKARTAIAEKEEMKKERDVYMARVESNAQAVEDSAYGVKRAKEEIEVLRNELEEARQSVHANGKPSSLDRVRDEMIRELQKKLNCSIVTTQRKDVVISRCGHLFSKQCTDNLIATRNRKCPICGKMFGVDDVMNVYF